MPQGPETRLVNRMRLAIHEAHPDAFVLKIHGSIYQAVGTPDLLICAYGRMVGIEVKCPRGRETHEAALKRVSPAQQAALNAIERAGGIAGVALTVAHALALVDKAQQKA